MERFITAPLQIEGKPVQREGYLEYTNPRLTPIDYTPQLSWVSLDIETEDFRGKLYSIAVQTEQHEQVFMVKEQSSDTSEQGYITWCPSEKSALQSFFNWIKKHCKAFY